MGEEQKPVTAPSSIKEWFGAAREGVIILAVVILFVKPSWIGTIAEEAGLKKAFGLEFVQQQVEESQKETSKAQESINAIAEELQGLKGQLQQISAPTTKANPEMARELTKIVKNIDNLAERSQNIKSTLQTSMKAQDVALKAARGELILTKPKSP